MRVENDRLRVQSTQSDKAVIQVGQNIKRLTTELTEMRDKVMVYEVQTNLLRKRKHGLETALAATRAQGSHERCHDLVCSGNRAFPRGEPGHCCSCAGRDGAYADLAAARAVLDTATLCTAYDIPERSVLTVDRAAWLAWQERSYE